MIILVSNGHDFIAPTDVIPYQAFLQLIAENYYLFECYSNCCFYILYLS